MRTAYKMVKFRITASGEIVWWLNDHIFTPGTVEPKKTNRMCESGYHSCDNAENTLSYHRSADCCLWKVELIGETQTKGDKNCSESIRLIHTIETNSGNGNFGFFNDGDENRGDGNHGNWNHGDGNRGNWNYGNWNRGNWNYGNWNRGNENRGDENSGNRNHGNRNRGDRNSGNGNRGDGNSGNGNSGDYNRGNKNHGNRNSDD